MESKPIATYEQRLIVEITFFYVVLTIAVMTVMIKETFNKSTDPVFAWVPIGIIEWAFLGGMVAVIYCLAYQRKRFSNLTQLVTWAIAKPLIGLVMGGLVYFMALSGQLYLNSGVKGAPPDLQNPQLFCVIAFIAAFSDRWSIDLIEKFTSTTGLAEGEQPATTQESAKEGQEPTKDGEEPTAEKPPVK